MIAIHKRFAGNEMMRKLLTIALVFAAITSSDAAPSASPPSSTLSQATTGSTVPSANPQAVALTAEDLRVFLDGFMPYALHRGDIAGATIAVVKDGHLLFSQGYGYADVRSKKPVIADETLFRVGSVSKLFVWTAVMQLVEQGKLDLDRDVNDYLDFKIPPKFGKPITMRNLMTHTPGFEDVFRYLTVADAKHLFPLHDYLVKQMPERIYPPGKIVAYSNYGVGLAAYVVQRVSGETYENYLENHILKPLGMDRTTLEQPPPPSLRMQTSTGYMQASDPKTMPFEYIEAAPVGGISATATDMAKFMIAQLENGAYDGARILKPATIEEMHSRNFTLAPRLLNGMNLGFWDMNRNGHRIIGHLGDSAMFHAGMYLMLDADVALFTDFNSAGNAGETDVVRSALFRSFLNRYFPFTPPVEKTVAHPEQDAARVAGYYMSSRHLDSSFRFFIFPSLQSKMSALPDGTISFAAFKDYSGVAKKWREVGPLYYREVGGQTHLEFVAGKNGNIEYFQSDDSWPIEVLRRVHGLEQRNLLLIFGVGTVAACLLTLAIWFGGWIVRLRFHSPLTMTTNQARLRLASRLGAALFVAVIVAWAGFFIVGTTGDTPLNYNPALDHLLSGLYVLGVLAAFGGVAMVVNGVARLVGGPGGWLVRTGDAVLALAGAYGIWLILHYDLANFSYNF